MMEPALRRRLAAAPVARLATVRPDGKPHVVVVTFALDGDRVVTAVDHKPKSTTRLQRLVNVRANPDVSLLVDHYEPDWSRLWWVRLDGTAREVTGGADHTAAIAPLVAKYPAYVEVPPTGPALVIDVSRVASWSP